MSYMVLVWETSEIIVDLVNGQYEWILVKFDSKYDDLKWSHFGYSSTY